MGNSARLSSSLYPDSGPTVPPTTSPTPTLGSTTASVGDGCGFDAASFDVRSDVFLRSMTFPVWWAPPTRLSDDTTSRANNIVLSLRQSLRTKSPRRKLLAKGHFRAPSMSGLSVRVCPVHRECTSQVCPVHRE